MKTLAAAILASVLAAVSFGAASACPYSNKSASLTDGGSYETAQKDQSSSSKTR